MGAILVLIAISIFWHLPHTNLTLAFIGAGILFFGIEAFFETFYMAGIVATGLLACGFWRWGVAPQLAFSLGVGFGTVSIALLSIAKRARENKRADL